MTGSGRERVLGGRYELGGLISYSSSAETHRARDLRLDRVVAVKLLRSDLTKDRAFRERLQREAMNAAALNEPTVAAVYDVGEEELPNGELLPYIVMEFVEGRMLQEILRHDERLPWRRAVGIVADVCVALEASHRRGLVHRNIKPGNVMLAAGDRVKVMNFGLAHPPGDGDAVIGTAAYLSPEQARGQAFDARSDVYSTGCLLFELIAGRPPFAGTSPVELAWMHVRADPPAPSTLEPQVPPAVDAIVLKALAKDPADRYQSAEEMRADLLRAGGVGPERSGRIFICYRRADSQHVAGRLADQLIGEFGEARIFIDVDSVLPGIDFVDEVRRTVRGCEVLLAVIGQQWAGDRRLEDPDDVVAMEIREALNSGVRVIPLLVDGAPMPRRDQLPAALAPLTRRNALRLAHETFRSDVRRLITDL